MAAGDRQGEPVRAAGVGDLQPHGRPGEPRGVGRGEVGGLGPAAQDPAAEPVAAGRLDQSRLRDRPGRAPRREHRGPPRGGRPIAAGPRQVDRLDLRLGAGASRVVAGLRPRPDDGQRQPPRRRVRRLRGPSAANPPAQARSLGAGDRLPRGADVEAVRPLDRRRGQVPRERRRLRAVGGHDLGPLLPPEGLAPPDRSQLDGAPHRHLGRLGGQDVQPDREGDDRPRRGRAVARAEADLQGIPREPFDDDLHRRRRRGPLRAVEQRQERDAHDLPVGPERQAGPDRRLDPARTRPVRPVPSAQPPPGCRSGPPGDPDGQAIASTTCPSDISRTSAAPSPPGGGPHDTSTVRRTGAGPPPAAGSGGAARAIVPSRNAPRPAVTPRRPLRIRKVHRPSRPGRSRARGRILAAPGPRRARPRPVPHKDRGTSVVLLHKASAVRPADWSHSRKNAKNPHDPTPRRASRRRNSARKSQSRPPRLGDKFPYRKWRGPGGPGGPSGSPRQHSVAENRARCP